MKQRVILLGSTGSIGKQTLEVLESHPNRFELIGISAKHDSALLRKQAGDWRPKIVACEEHPEKEAYPDSTELIEGTNASERLASVPCDILILAISGFAALKPLVKALPVTKRIAIANKESLVCGGSLIKDLARQNGAVFLPIDSEQSAIFQCMRAGTHEEIERIILTASGGPFFRRTRKELESVSMDQVLSHPTWNMGRKITLDSATMFNKGLEIMEASRLFDLPGERISVLIHPQSVVHSIVEFSDGSMIANLAVPDMRLPIQYALTWPERIVSPAKRLDLASGADLSFHEPDLNRFPAIKMAYEALRLEQGYPIVYNGANEAAAALYFSGAIAFCEIERYVEQALSLYQPQTVRSTGDIFAVDAWSRSCVNQLLKEI